PRREHRRLLGRQEGGQRKLTTVRAGIASKGRSGSHPAMVSRNDGWLVGWLERMRGIEPPSQAWEACVLPLNHIRVVPLRERSVTTGRVAAEYALRTGLELLEGLLRRRHDLLNGIAKEGSLHRVEGSRIP